MTDADSFDLFNEARARFLSFMASEHLSSSDDTRCSVVILTHLLADRPVFIEALSRYLTISRVIAIPYSTDQRVADWVAARFSLAQPSLQELQQGGVVRDALLHDGTEAQILIEIGGYGARYLQEIVEDPGCSLLGVIEGTEAGHRAYRRVANPQVPIVCMNLSPTKKAESSLVGQACVFSTSAILRKLGFSTELKRACVLGYGRVGRSVAEALVAGGFQTTVYDPNPERRLEALAAGFPTPSREKALAGAELIFGASGERSWIAQDAPLMHDGAFLVSCSSQDVEFGVAELAANFLPNTISDGVDQISIAGRRLYFLANGTPVNFRDGANAGPILTLLQAEMIASCGDLVRGALPTGIQAPSSGARARILDAWTDYYVDPTTGWYRANLRR